MADKPTPKKQTKAKKEDFSKVLPSKEVVNFKYSKDHGKKKAGDVVSINKQSAEILELKGLGKQSK